MDYVRINKSIVNGTCVIGIGFTQLVEFAEILDIPYMAPKICIKYIDLISDNIEKLMLGTL